MKKWFKYIIGIFVILLVCGFTLSGKFTHENFDSKKWKHANLNSEENISLRWDMMNNLRNNYNLIGKTKLGIIRLLGNSEGNIENEMTYYLGYSKTGINTGKLTLTLDKKGIVINVNVWQG
jgi:hypothetical protein